MGFNIVFLAQVFMGWVLEGEGNGLKVWGYEMVRMLGEGITKTSSMRKRHLWGILVM